MNNWLIAHRNDDVCGMARNNTHHALIVIRFLHSREVTEVLPSPTFRTYKPTIYS